LLAIHVRALTGSYRAWKLDAARKKTSARVRTLCRHDFVVIGAKP
jgi:hypothetical protein